MTVIVNPAETAARLAAALETIAKQDRDIAALKGVVMNIDKRLSALERAWPNQ